MASLGTLLGIKNSEAKLLRVVRVDFAVDVFQPVGWFRQNYFLRGKQESCEYTYVNSYTREVTGLTFGIQLPSNVTNGYLREAVNTYTLGLPQASVARSRAPLEQALKEGIGYKFSTFIKMNNLLDEAESADVIDNAHRYLARQIADAADDVLYEKPTTLSKSLDVLTRLRGILQFIYSRE